MQLRDRGISVVLPSGFEGRIFVRPSAGPANAGTVMHLATFPLLPGFADFGGGATPTMRVDDIFVVLFEYGEESVGKRLFEHHGIPRRIAMDRISPFYLRRGVAGQAGTQLFFTANQRPFTLYAVLGSYARRYVLLPRVHHLLEGIDIAAVR